MPEAEPERRPQTAPAPTCGPARQDAYSPLPAFTKAKHPAAPGLAAAAVAIFVVGVGLFFWRLHSPPRSADRAVPAAAAAQQEKRDTVLHFVPATAGIYALQIDGLMLGQIAAQPEGLYLSVPFKHGGTSYVTVSLVSESAVDPSLPMGCSGELCTRVTVPGDRKVEEMRFRLGKFNTGQVWTFTVD
ncbi:MAG: hypothetical protein PHU21_02675 [Elusimicrobia bacterium]|nr:hypothetical protein [Elusimicrobiota bacterium]